MKRLLAATPPSRWRAFAAAVLAPAVAVGMALSLGPGHLAAASALCLLAVVVAAALGGSLSGVVTSALSFLALNLFFTEPRFTLSVRDATDWVSLLVFLLVALIVGSLLGRALEERSLAERRATEAQLLSRTTARLISAVPLRRILDDFAAEIVRLFDLARCEIETPAGVGSASRDEASPRDDAAPAGHDAAGVGPSITIPLATPGGSFGALSATRPVGGLNFSLADVELLRAVASQTAVALERAALHEEVRSAHLEAEASRIRAALFSSVTHDLRTPLASIKGNASALLADGASFDEAERRSMIGTIIGEADRLNRIVGNLLDLARMRAGALVPSKQPILVEDVIAAVLRRFQRELEGMAVRTTIRPHLPQVDADPVQLEQVLSNLLENAIRFSPRGGEIRVSAARWHDAVQVRVADSGPGIPPAERVRVFDEFYRRDVGAGRGGTGLGLTIARAIVTSHGGRIWAEDAPGGGAAIVFELPSSRAAPPTPAPEPDDHRAAP